MPRHSISVTSTMPGTVAALFHYEGDYVHSGEQLLQIKPSPRPQDLAATRRELEKKYVAEKTASAHLQRVQQLLKRGFAHQDEYATAQKEFQEAVIDRKMAQEKLSLLQKGEATVGKQLIKSIITSPIDGFILARTIDVGDSIAPQTDAQKGSVLFTIANMADLIFSGQVSEVDAGKIHEAMPASITIGALPDLTISGKISKIALQSENLSSQIASSNNLTSATTSSQNSNSPFNVGYKIEIAELTLPQNIRLRSGYSATADIIVSQLSKALLIPERVLIFRDNKVWVKLPGNPPQEKEIKLGLSDGIHAQVISGLNEGDIVLDNITSLEFSSHKRLR